MLLVSIPAIKYLWIRSFKMLCVCVHVCTLARTRVCVGACVLWIHITVKVKCIKNGKANLMKQFSEDNSCGTGLVVKIPGKYKHRERKKSNQNKKNSNGQTSIHEKWVTDDKWNKELKKIMPKMRMQRRKEKIRTCHKIGNAEKSNWEKNTDSLDKSSINGHAKSWLNAVTLGRQLEGWEAKGRPGIMILSWDNSSKGDRSTEPNDLILRLYMCVCGAKKKSVCLLW